MLKVPIQRRHIACIGLRNYFDHWHNPFTNIAYYARCMKYFRISLVAWWDVSMMFKVKQKIYTACLAIFQKVLYRRHDMLIRGKKRNILNISKPRIRILDQRRSWSYERKMSDRFSRIHLKCRKFPDTQYGGTRSAQGRLCTTLCEDCRFSLRCSDNSQRGSRK